MLIKNFGHLWERKFTDHLWNRWQSFSWYGICGVNQNGSLSAYDRQCQEDSKSNGKGLLGEFEAILITALEPKLNKQ